MISINLFILIVIITILWLLCINNTNDNNNNRVMLIGNVQFIYTLRVLMSDKLKSINVVGN